MSALSPDRSTIDLVGQIYDAVLDHEQWPRLVRELADTFNSKSALLRLMDCQCEYVSFTVAYGYDERFFGPYREHYIHIDPFNAYLMDRPLGTMVCTPEIMPMNQLGAALLKRRPAARNLAVGADVFGDLCTRHASPVMRRGSLPGELAALGSCVVAPARSEMPGSWPSRH